MKHLTALLVVAFMCGCVSNVTTDADLKAKKHCSKTCVCVKCVCCEACPGHAPAGVVK